MLVVRDSTHITGFREPRMAGLMVNLLYIKFDRFVRWKVLQLLTIFLPLVLTRSSKNAVKSLLLLYLVLDERDMYDTN